MAGYTLTDLDQRPELLPNALALFATAAPGSQHVVCGLPARMGLEPTADDLKGCLGVLVALAGRRLAGALAICPYSENQVTLWGPVIPDQREQQLVVPALVQELRRALREGSYHSMRALVDARNRNARAWLMAQGFTVWKDMLLFERDLVGLRDQDVGGARRVARGDHEAVAAILAEAFPDSDHCQPNLVRRENEGYRHYLLERDGVPVAAAAVQEGGRRSWLKLIATAGRHRGQGHSHALLRGLLAAEARLGHQAIGLEVLADNRAAITLYEHAGFTRRWTAGVLIAPV